MADDSYNEQQPAVVYDFIPPKGNRRKEDQPINRRVPDIMYDDRSTYRSDFNGNNEPYEEDLKFRADTAKPTEYEARGVLPGFLGQKYTDVYSRMEPNLPEGYQWAGTQRKREQLANNLAAQREHDRSIPGPTMTMPEEPYERMTMYREQYCRTTEEKDAEGYHLPDIQPMNKGTYKYHHNQKFSYNSTQNNKAY